MASQPTEVYEFGDFRLDVAEHRLGRVDDGRVAPLSEKPFQTLLYLVRNHGHLVSKTELLDAVWPDAAVEENNLDKSIHAIRQVLGDKAGNTRYVETVRKHGYRFIADVKLIVPPSDHAADGADADLPRTETIPFGLSKSGAHAIVGLDEWNSLAERFQLDTNLHPLASEENKLPQAEQGPSAEKSSNWPVFKIAAAALMILAVAALLLYVFNRRGLPAAKGHTPHEFRAQTAQHRTH